MKRSRMLLWMAAAAISVLVIVVSAALTSKVQTWAVRRFLASRPALGVSVQKVSAGLGWARFQGVRCQRIGVNASVPQIDVDFSIWRALAGRLAIKRLSATGWNLELGPGWSSSVLRTAGKPIRRGGWPSLLSSAHAADIPVTAVERIPDGIVSRIRLPMMVSIERLALAGRISLPMSGMDEPIRTNVTISGGGLVPGEDARFDVNVSAEMPRTSPVKEIQGSGMVSGRLESTTGFSQVAVMFSARALGPRMPNPAHLSLQANLIRSQAGESYLLELSSDGKALVETRSQLAAHSGRLDGEWKVNLSDADLASFALGRPLPRFSVRGDGKFGASVDGRDFQVRGSLVGELDKLACLSSRLESVGALSFGGAFNIDRKEDDIRVAHLSVTVQRGGRHVIEAETLQGFEFDMATAEMKVADPSKDLARISLVDVPTAWIPRMAEGWVITGEGVSGGFLLAAHDGGFALSASAPLVIRGMGLRAGAHEVLRGVDASAKVSADYTPAGWQADVSDLQLRDPSGALVGMRFRAGGLADSAGTIKFQGECSLSLPGCFAQPGLADHIAFKAGTLEGNIQGSLGPTKEILLHLSTRGAVVDAPVRRDVPDLNLEVRASEDAAGVVTIRAPFVADNTRLGRKSDLLLDATVRRRGGVYAFGAKVSGVTDYLDDLGAVFAFANAGLAWRTGAGDPSRGNSDSLPWAGAEGTCSILLGRMVVSPDATVENAAAELRLGADGAELSALHASFNDTCVVAGNATLAYLMRAPDPFTIRTEFSATGLDSSWLMTGNDGMVSPAIEAKFDVSGTLSGSGRSVAAAARASHGHLVFLSKGGRFRLLRTNINGFVAPKDSLGESVMSGLGAILGRSGDRKGGAAVDEYGRMAQELSSALADLRFDQMSVDASLDEKGALLMKDFTLITPQVRLAGSGEIQAGQGVAISGRPLSLNLQMALRGSLAGIADRTKLTNGKTDELGYLIVPYTFHLGGTLAHCDTGELSKLVGRVALARKDEAFLDRLRGK